LRSCIGQPEHLVAGEELLLCLGGFRQPDRGGRVSCDPAITYGQLKDQEHQAMDIAHQGRGQPDLGDPLSHIGVSDFYSSERSASLA
jgi:hypothetical protein